ncbi:MAG: serine/threonine-protein kinase [Polyangiaceae bacterium]
MRGLAAAHHAGVVHRDLKPDNVMLAKDGRVVITDFGIARDPVAAAQGETLGIVVGTPAYMAPEQVEASTTMDARTDIYALGVMLFELFTGELPFKGSAMALAAARLYAPPPDPRTLAPTLPAAIAEVVLRCLAQDRAARFADALEVANALSASSPTLEQGSAIPKPSIPPPSAVAEGQREKAVAVLPFRNLGPSGDEYVADGITDDLIDSLSMTAGLRVRPRGSVTRFKGVDADPREIGRDLGVDVVVEGSVRRLESRVRLTARVTSVEDGFQLWAQRFDRPANDLLVVSDETARAVAEALTVRSAGRQHVAPSDAGAVDLYLKARAEVRDPRNGSIERAIGLFRAAHERAPEDIAILSGYARACARLWFFRGDVRHPKPRATPCAGRARVEASPRRPRGPDGPRQRPLDER